MDHIQGMQVFLKVAQAGSLSAAASQLDLSKSSVSKHISALERRLGVLLLNRSTRRLSLTELGRAYRDHCARILADIEETEQAIQAHTTRAKGRLKVNAPMSFGILHIAPLLAGFMAAHPEVEIDLVLNDRRVDLIDEGFDLAIRIGRLDDSNLIAKKLASAGHVCCASDTYVARHRPPEVPEDLTRHNCLRYTYNRAPGEWQFSRDGETRSVRVTGNIQANNGEALREAALAGLGVVYQPVFIVAAELRTGRLRPLLEDWSTPMIDIHAVYPEQRQLQPKLRHFVDHLARNLRRPELWPDMHCPVAA